jgi:16S rRNA (cytosine967-C5)-methyltransferase
MTPGARVEAAIELLDGIIAAAREGGAAADTLIARYFGTRRYAGSKDRRAVRELVYAAIRLAGELPASGRAAMLALADRDPTVAAGFDGSPHGPAPIGDDEPRAEPGIAPAWLVAALAESGIPAAAMSALVERARLDIRINTLKPAPDLPDAMPLPFAPGGLRLPSGTNVETLPAWRDGAIEVQDEGSQIVSLALPVAPGDAVIDLCAGAGGKTLALAARMANTGTLIACDTDRARLSRLAPRAERAGATIIDARLLDPGREAAALGDWQARADGVLVDAPCSGTGTWRRNPEARWRLDARRLARLAETQAHVLSLGAALVRPGGSLVYIVCSLLDMEGREQVDRFLADHPGWRSEVPVLPVGQVHGAGIRLDPARAGTDGFFVARLIAPC